jgi:hypothetical protein
MPEGFGGGEKMIPLYFRKKTRPVTIRIRMMVARIIFLFIEFSSFFGKIIFYVLAYVVEFPVKFSKAGFGLHVPTGPMISRCK